MAKKNTRAATKAPALTLHLRTRDDFTHAVDTVATAQLELIRLKAARDLELAAINATHGPAIESLEAKIKLHLEAAATYAENFAPEVFPDPKLKSSETTLATYGLRTDPPSITQAPKVKAEESILRIQTAIKAQADIANSLEENGTDREAWQAACDQYQRLTAALREVIQLNKEHLHSFTEEELAPFGLRKTQTDQFWIKGKEETATRDKTTTPAA